MPNGALLEFRINNVFLNPVNVQPINVATTIDIEDANGNLISAYDASSKTTLYTAEVVKI